MDPASCEMQQEIKDATQTDKSINMIQKKKNLTSNRIQQITAKRCLIFDSSFQNKTQEFG